MSYKVGNNMAKSKPKSEVKKKGRPSQWNEETVKAFGDKLLKWSERDDSLVIGSFNSEHPHDPDVIYDLAAKYDNFQLIVDKARTNVGTRRERMAFTGEGNASVWNKTARFYDKRLHEHLNKETYDSAFNDSKGRLAGSGVDEDTLPDILQFIASQKSGK